MRMLEHDQEVGNRSFGELIRRHRQGRHLTAEELADSLGRPQSFVSRLETGRFVETPPPDVMAALRDQIGVTVEAQLLALGYEFDEAGDVQFGTRDQNAELLCEVLKQASPIDDRERAFLLDAIRFMRGKP